MGIIWTKLRQLFLGKHLELCMVGLENSGKTTLLTVLSLGHAVETLPTIGLNVKMMNQNGVKMRAWDLGGQERFRQEWARYSQNCDVILYVVDSNDVDKIPIAKKELHKLLSDKNLNSIPVLLVANKCDLEPRLRISEIQKALAIDQITTNPFHSVSISALKKTGINEVIDWLVAHAK